MISKYEIDDYGKASTASTKSIGSISRHIPDVEKVLAKKTHVSNESRARDRTYKSYPTKRFRK